MCLYPVKIKDPRYTDGEVHEPLLVPCGKCLECLQQSANEWAHRIVDECAQYTDNCFLTLTYNNEHLPENSSLCRRDLQLFIKRLRKHLEPLKVRYFGCGEYGNHGHRPHYHLIVFGWKPPDLRYWQKEWGGCMLYRSPIVERLWSVKDDNGKLQSIGYSSVGEVTIDTAKYCAKYLQKLNKKYYVDRLPPFTCMSNRPGIGYNSISAKSLSTDRIYHNGKYVHLPRYYLKVLERNGHDLTEFKERRILVGKLKQSRADLLRRRKKSFEFLGKKC